MDGKAYRRQTHIVNFTETLDIQRMTGTNLSWAQKRTIIYAPGAHWEVWIGDIGKIRYLCHDK